MGSGYGMVISIGLTASKTYFAGSRSTAVEVLVRNTTFIDDFVFDREGIAWAALDTSWELGTIKMCKQNVNIILGSSN